jgi:hypothetical protein
LRFCSQNSCDRHTGHECRPVAKPFGQGQTISDNALAAELASRHGDDCI